MQQWVVVGGRLRGEHVEPRARKPPFVQRIGERRRMDLLDIASSLRNLPGWRPVPGRTRVPNYGSQQVYERVPELNELL